MDHGSSCKTNDMKNHMEECKIEPDYIPVWNHRANGIAEQMIQEVNWRINTIGPKERMKFHKHMKDIEQAIHTKQIKRNSHLKPSH